MIFGQPPDTASMSFEGSCYFPLKLYSLGGISDVVDGRVRRRVRIGVRPTIHSGSGRAHRGFPRADEGFPIEPKLSGGTDLRLDCRVARPPLTNSIDRRDRFIDTI
jgi:hypothetical protein